MKQLSWVDAAFIRIESPTTPAHVNPVLVYDPSTAPGGAVTFADILAAVEARLHLAPSFRRKLVDLPVGGIMSPFWVDDPDFDLEFHVRQVALPKPGDWRQFCIQVARLHARQLDLSRPPWELTVIEGLDTIPGLPPGSFCLSLKVHHSAIDGIAGAEMITAIHDHAADAPPPPPPERPWAPRPLPSTARLLQAATWSGVRHPVKTVRVLGGTTPGMVRSAVRRLTGGSRGGLPVPRTRFNEPVTAHRVFEARFYPFQDIRRIKNAVPGATVNDAALAHVGGALRHYLSHHGELPEESLVAGVPISLRTPDQPGSDGGNMISAMRQPLRTEIADPLERLAAIQAATGQDRTTRKAVGAPALLQVAELLPGALLGLGLRASVAFGGTPPLANVTVTNVPGPPAPLYFCGARLLHSTGNGPVFHGLGLIHLVGSYAGEWMASITCDREMMPDPAFYAECLDASFAELLAAAERVGQGGAKERGRVSGAKRGKRVVDLTAGASSPAPSSA